MIDPSVAYSVGELGDGRIVSHQHGRLTVLVEKPHCFQKHTGTGEVELGVAEDLIRRKTYLIGYHLRRRLRSQSWTGNHTADRVAPLPEPGGHLRDVPQTALNEWPIEIFELGVIPAGFCMAQ